MFRVDQIKFISVPFAKNLTASDILKFGSDNGNIQRYIITLKGKRLPPQKFLWNICSNESSVITLVNILVPREFSEFINSKHDEQQEKYISKINTVKPFV